MIFPQGIIGPRFEKGDLATFVFDGAELTLRLPVVPVNKNNLDDVSRIKDFRGIDTHHWDLNDQEAPCIQLSQQSWSFEDVRSLDDVAECYLYVSLMEVDKASMNSNVVLNAKNFESLMFSWLDYSFLRRETEKLDGTTKRYNYKLISKPHLDWHFVQVRFVDGAPPTPMVIMPINSRFVVMISIELQSLHYAGRSNPYSDELLKQFESDLFEDFLTHIDVRYTPETIAIIKSLKQSATAGI